MPVISAVVVSFRSAALAARAFATLRASARGAGLALETIAVVNSGDEEEARALRTEADLVLLPGRNLGYAGGLNAGAAAAKGDVLFLANPDLAFRAGAAGALFDAALSGPVAAGPALFLDEGETIHLPPGEEPSPATLARRRLAAAGAPSVFRRNVRRALAAAREADEGATAAVTALSGALLAVSRRTLEAAGPFDEGYALYYEENDWQKRLRARGGRLLRVGAARVVHAYNRSARLEPKAAAWFADSERRYFTKHFGAAGERALAAVASAPASPPLPAPPHLADGTLRFEGEAAVALSPLRDFATFALVPRCRGEWRPAPDVLEGFRGTDWYVRAVDPGSLVTLGEGKIS